MLARLNAIKKAQDFQTIFKKAKSFRNNIFIFKTMKNGLEISRFAFVVSQKVSKKATIRNKVRRRLAESVRAEMKSVKKGTDSLFIALPGVEKKEFAEIKKTVNDALIKSGLIGLPSKIS